MLGFEFHGNTVKSNPNSNNSSLWLILCEFDVKTMTRVLCVCFMYSHQETNTQRVYCVSSKYIAAKVLNINHQN